MANKINWFDGFIWGMIILYWGMVGYNDINNIVSIKWHETQQDLEHYKSITDNEKIREVTVGIAILNKKGCIIYAPKPDYLEPYGDDETLEDTEKMATIGHEMMHCFGHRHTSK